MGILEGLRSMLAVENPSEVSAIVKTTQIIYAAAMRFKDGHLDDADFRDLVGLLDLALQEKNYSMIEQTFSEWSEHITEKMLTNYYGNFVSSVLTDGFEFVKVGDTAYIGAAGHNSVVHHSVAILFKKDGRKPAGIGQVISNYDDKKFEYRNEELLSCSVSKEYAVGFYMDVREDEDGFDTPKEAYEAAGLTPPDDVDNYFRVAKSTYSSSWWWNLDRSCNLTPPKPRTRKTTTPPKTTGSSSPAKTTTSKKTSAKSSLDILDVHNVGLKLIDSETTENLVKILATVLASNKPTKEVDEIMYLIFNGIPSSATKEILDDAIKEMPTAWEKVEAGRYVGFTTLITSV